MCFALATDIGAPAVLAKAAAGGRWLTVGGSSSKTVAASGSAALQADRTSGHIYSIAEPRMRTAYHVIGVTDKQHWSVFLLFLFIHISSTTAHQKRKYKLI